jgi:hypothetical protein
MVHERRIGDGGSEIHRFTTKMGSVTVTVTGPHREAQEWAMAISSFLVREQEESSDDNSE